MKSIIPSDPDLSRFTAIVDTREQLACDVPVFKMERMGLDTGDYSIKGLEPLVTVERKSLPDLIACIGGERKRFERCLRRMRDYKQRAVVVEAHRYELKDGNWRANVTPESAVGTVSAWEQRGVVFYFCGALYDDKGELIQSAHEAAALKVYDILRLAVKNWWKQMRPIVNEYLETEATP